MKYFCSFIALLSLSTILSANPISDRVNSISALIYDYPDSAYFLAQELMNDALDKGDEYGTVQSNFILAYIQDKVKGDYGKAILYYLEAIRYANDSNYDQVIKDRISLHKNCGVIFRKFKSYALAHDYYDKALETAINSGNDKEISSISYNISGLMMDQKRYEEAIYILNNLINGTDSNSKDYWKYSNRLGIALYESGDFDLAIDAHKSSLMYKSLDKELEAYAIHNIGRCYASLDNFKLAHSNFYKALGIKKQLEDESTLFSTYSELGDLELRNGNAKKALIYFSKAEKRIDEVTDLNHFELFKSKADALFAIKDFNEAKRYEDLYSESLNNYLRVQEEVQEANKSYNMDLITKRYFDEVAKQERIASILFYSRLISGSLLALLLFTVGFNWYQKVQLRRGIVKELVKLKIVD